MPNATLVAVTLNALSEADVVVWPVEPRPPALGLGRPAPSPAVGPSLIVGINKIDTAAKPRLLPIISAYHELFPAVPIIPLTALLGDGVPELKAEILKLLPASPPFYPPDQETDSTERFLVAELIRERVLHHTSEEIPHAVAVQVEEFDESRRPHLIRIRTVIFVERNSQKGILIGKQGRMLKAIGAEARGEIEALLGAKVFLELWVKVWKNWRKDPKALRALGLQA